MTIFILLIFLALYILLTTRGQDGMFEEYTGIEPPETVMANFAVYRGLMRFPDNDYPQIFKPGSTVRG